MAGDELLERVAIQHEVARRFGEDGQWDEAVARIHAAQAAMQRLSTSRPEIGETPDYQMLFNELEQDRARYEAAHAAWRAEIERRQQAFFVHEKAALDQPIEGPPLPELPAKRGRKLARFISERRERRARQRGPDSPQGDR